MTGTLTWSNVCGTPARILNFHNCANDFIYDLSIIHIFP